MAVLLRFREIYQRYLLDALFAAATLGLGAGMTAIPVVSGWAGPLGLGVFAIAYALVVMEERLQLRKSKPVMIAAGVLWIIIGIVCVQQGDTYSAAAGVRHYDLRAGDGCDRSRRRWQA